MAGIMPDVERMTFDLNLIRSLGVFLEDNSLLDYSSRWLNVYEWPRAANPMNNPKQSSRNYVIIPAKPNLNPNARDQSPGDGIGELPSFMILGRPFTLSGRSYPTRIHDESPELNNLRLVKLKSDLITRRQSLYIEYNDEELLFMLAYNRSFFDRFTDTPRLRGPVKFDYEIRPTGIFKVK